MTYHIKKNDQLHNPAQVNRPKFTIKRIVQMNRSKSVEIGQNLSKSVKICQKIGKKSIKNVLQKFPEKCRHFFSSRKSLLKFQICCTNNLYFHVIIAPTESLFFFFLCCMLLVQRFTRLIIFHIKYFTTFFKKRSRTGRLQTFTPACDSRFHAQNLNIYVETVFFFDRSAILHDIVFSSHGRLLYSNKFIEINLFLPCFYGFM